MMQDNVITFTELQSYGYRLAIQGHNLLITGQCGTGKTHLLRCIINKLTKDKSVAVTATTGMASTQLGLSATTVHHWSGLGDVRYTKEELLTRFMSDDRFSDARMRITSADILAIDEVGMLSETTFDKLEMVCRIGRKNNQLFGGLQVIASGDFKQLPPVPNYRYRDPGTYCFQSAVFTDVFAHHTNLEEVVRQNEVDLIKAINELCNGSPSEETEHLLRNLDRPLVEQDEVGVCRLFGTNFDATYVNQMHLDEEPGNAVVYKSKDEGKTSLLKGSDAEKALVLKVGAPVILTRNLPGKLFNGLMGKVNSVNEETGPVVNFKGRLVKIGVVRFEVYDPVLKMVLATRVQYPLKLAYALTVHRAQGQTLPRVEIDCYSFFSPGQMGVAVGRAVTKDGLRISNYNSYAAHLKHPQVVYDFYTSESLKPEEDLSCCKKDFPDECSEIDKFNNLVVDSSTPTIHFPERAHSSGDETYEECPLPINDFLNQSEGQSYIPHEQTDEFKNQLSQHSRYLYFNVQTIMKIKTKTTDDFTALYKQANSFLTSEDHTTICQNLMSHKPQKLSSCLFLWMLQKEIEIKSEKILEKQTEKFELVTDDLPADYSTSSAAKAKVRYIAGACIHKILTRLRAIVLAKIGKSDKKTKADRDWNYRLQRLLKSLRITEEKALNATSCPESMVEIDAKQGPSRGLLHISDDVFNFFLHINAFLQKLLSPTSFHLFGSSIHLVCRQKLFNNSILMQEWTNLFEGPDDKADEDENVQDDDEVFSSMLLELFQLVVEHFLRILIVEGLKHFKSEIPKKKAGFA